MKSKEDIRKQLQTYKDIQKKLEKEVRLSDLERINYVINTFKWVLEE